MRSHVKASSAGSTSGRSGRVLLACLCALALSSALGAGSAVAKTYVPGSPASFCSGTTAAAGHCGELSGVAVDSSNGHVYVVDRGNLRIDEFDSTGAFVKAFGSGVAGGTGAQVCGPLGIPPGVACAKGKTTGNTGAIETVTAKGIAVDPENHVVYVVAAPARVTYFNGTTGALLGETNGTTSGAPEAFANLVGLAIDSSNPLQHYLYVAMKKTSGTPESARGKIDKFKTSSAGLGAGTYACQITGTPTDTSFNHTECGGNGILTHRNGLFEGIDPGNGTQQGGSLAVDANGNVFIAEAQISTRQYISIFDKNGNFVTQFKPSGSVSPNPAVGAEPRPEAIATLPNGNVLVADGGASSGAGGNRVQEFNPASPASPVAEFGLGTIGGSFGLATQGEDVFVADKTNKTILKFIVDSEAPSVTTAAATELSKFKATLNGSVTPNRLNVTDCHFEYLTHAAYQGNGNSFTGANTPTSAPCVPAAPGSGATPVAVNAKLSGLQFGSEYHVRLLATNSKGTTTGNEITFSTTFVNKPEVTTTPGATLITQTTAKLAGKVNPNEVQATDCHFKYLTDAAYQANFPADRFQGAATAPCAPDAATIGAGGSLVDVSASLSALDPGTTYHFLLKATNADGTSENTDEQSFKTLPIAPVVSEASSEAVQIAAVVKAKVNPNSGPAAYPLTACRIDYGTTPSYGQTKPCTPSPGPGSVPVDVSFSLTGLIPGTTYFYRVFAANAGGSSEEAKTFRTLPPNLPAAFNDGSTAGPSDTFTLEGRVDPEGIAVTDCHFAYGPTAEYGKTAPCTPSAANLGSGDSQISVTAATEPLEPNTTYHFRLFAANVRGSTQGKDRILTTGSAPSDSCANAAIRAEQGIEVARLPDCLALEQVSPSKKGNQSARLKVGGNSLSPDGSRVLFNSAATLGDCPNINGITGDGFIAIRDPEGGWQTECVTPPVDAEFTNSFGGLSFDPGLTRWVQLIRTTSQELKYFTTGLGISRTSLSPDLVNLTASGGPGFLGASADHSHVYLGPQGNKEGTFLPGDPVPTGQGEDSNLYVTHLDSSGTPSLQLAAKDLNDKVWGGNCGARLGGMESNTGLNLNLSNGLRNQGAISADGTRVYFSTRPSQPTNTTPGGPITGACEEANKKRIMLREETPGGVQIKELVASECNRVTPDPACSATDGDDVYQGASVDQKLVYFTTTRQLDNADLDSNANSCDRTTAVSGCDLYLYDESKPEGEQLIDVSAGESTATTPGIGASVRNSITAISADGSHAYFVARTVLTTDPNPTEAVAQPNANNLYLYDHASEDLSFLGTLANGDGGSLFGGNGNLENDAFVVPTATTDSEGNEVGGDGHLLHFNSQAQLDPADTDSARDLYRYDAENGTLELLSKALPGGSGNGAFDTRTNTYLGESPGTDYADNGRWVSEDGDSVAFTTQEALFPGDTNGAEDSYLWRDGELYHLPGSTRSSPSANAIRPLVSRDGSTIAYHSTQRLTASDIDSVEDVYVLRPGGGFSTPTTTVCQGEACQGAPSALSGEIGATTGSGGSAGNAQPTATKCPKGKRKVRRGGKARCVRPAKHQKKKHAKQKRTSSKQGGQK